MKRFFTFLGILTLACSTFIYTEKTMSVLKENDEIMIEIKRNSKNYEYDALDAYITDTTIIPGINGQNIDLNKSYRKMKKYGTYNKNLMEFDYIKPNKLLKDNLDKYVVSGNSKKNMISLVFVVLDGNNIDNIIDILDSKNVKATFFVDGNFLEKNNDTINLISEKGHEIGNLSYNMDYTNSAFSWMNSIINSVSNQKNGYCYFEKEDSAGLSVCASYKSISIKPNIIVSDSPLMTVKNNIVSGSIISFKVNDMVNKELGSIINYINSKGYKIEKLNEHLKE